MSQTLPEGHVLVPSQGATGLEDHSSATPLVQNIPSIDSDTAALATDADVFAADEARLATDVAAYESTVPVTTPPTPAAELTDIGAALSAASAQHDADVTQAAKDAATIADLQAQLAGQTTNPPPVVVPDPSNPFPTV